MSGTILWLGADDARWGELLARAAAHDVYHLPAYHALAQRLGEGEPRLLVYMEGERFAALPLLVRGIEGAEGLVDATSVYGYPGPFVSDPPPDAAMAARFRAALARRMAAEGVVSVFSRLHPLLPAQAGLLAGLGELPTHGSTISLDLHLPPDQQTAGYSSNHRRNLDKLKKAGFACYLDDGFAHLDGFIAVYHENMRRIGADAYYLFGRDYFQGLREALGDGLVLLACRQGGELAGGALFTRARGIAQYHLGAVATAHLRMAPLKQLIDTARAVLAEAGDAVLHLGGGRGGAEDSLFHFKAGFSDRRHPFHTWRWIVRPEDYARLTGKRAVREGFFPAYRG